MPKGSKTCTCTGGETRREEHLLLLVSNNGYVLPLHYEAKYMLLKFEWTKVKGADIGLAEESGCQWGKKPDDWYYLVICPSAVYLVCYLHICAFLNLSCYRKEVIKWGQGAREKTGAATNRVLQHLTYSVLLNALTLSSVVNLWMAVVTPFHFYM